MHLIEPASPAAPSRCPIFESIQRVFYLSDLSRTHIGLDGPDDELIGAASLYQRLGYGSQLDGVTHRGTCALKTSLG